LNKQRLINSLEAEVNESARLIESMGITPPYKISHFHRESQQPVDQGHVVLRDGVLQPTGQQGCRGCPAHTKKGPRVWGSLLSGCPSLSALDYSLKLALTQHGVCSGYVYFGVTAMIVRKSKLLRLTYRLDVCPENQHVMAFR